MLKWRVATALVLLPLVLACVFLLPTPWFAAAFGVVILLAAWEWAPMAGMARASLRWAYLSLLALLFTIVGVSLDSGLMPVVLAVGVGWWLLALALLVRFNHSHRPARPLSAGAGAALGLLLLVPAWAGLVWLHAQADGPWLVLLLLILTWAADIGAYFAGRSFGRHKLALRISPGKTWEGALGGLLLALLAAFAMRAAFPAPSLDALLFGLLVTGTIIFSVTGDLYESMVKRRAGVKDSGTLLPGHGGMLDRIDSLVATAPLFAAGLYWQ